MIIKLIKISLCLYLITNFIDIFSMLRTRNLGIDLDTIASMSNIQKDRFYRNWQRQIDSASEEAKNNMYAAISEDIGRIKEIMQKIDQKEFVADRPIVGMQRLKAILQKKITLLESLMEPFKTPN